MTGVVCCVLVVLRVGGVLVVLVLVLLVLDIVFGVMIPSAGAVVDLESFFETTLCVCDTKNPKNHKNNHRWWGVGSHHHQHQIRRLCFR